MTHSSILAWKISRTEEPGGLQSRGHKESGMTAQLTVTYILIYVHIICWCVYVCVCDVCTYLCI